MKGINKKLDNINDSQVSSEKKKSKNILLLALARHKIGLLLVLLLVLISSTLCWFIFNTQVDLDIQAHVKSWNFGFDDNGSIEVKIDDLFPGVDDQEYSLDLVNYGEMDGTISIDIASITLFGEEQVKGVNYTVERSVDGNTLNIIGYPFDAQVVLGKNTLIATEDTNKDTTKLDFKLVWDYDNSDPDCVDSDSGKNICDIADTELGSKSYIFSNDLANADTPSLIIEISVDIVQA